MVYQQILEIALDYVKGFKTQFHVGAATDAIIEALAASPKDPHLTTAFEALIAHADEIFTSPTLRSDSVFLLQCAVAFLQSQPRS